MYIHVQLTLGSYISWDMFDVVRMNYIEFFGVGVCCSKQNHSAWFLCLLHWLHYRWSAIYGSTGAITCRWHRSELFLILDYQNVIGLPFLITITIHYYNSSPFMDHFRFSWNSFPGFILDDVKRLRQHVNVGGIPPRKPPRFTTILKYLMDNLQPLLQLQLLPW